jgi:hypothetical protein
MPTEPIKPKKKRGTEKQAELFPRGQRGVVCYRVEQGLRSPPADRMLRADRHVTKRALAEIAARPEADYVHD